MAVTAGILNGTDLLVYSGNNVLGHSTECSISVSQDLRDASTKASAGWKAVLPGQRSWQVECKGFAAFDANYNIAYLLGLITNKTMISLYFRTANGDNGYWYGSAYVASVEANAPNQGNVTYSASFTGNGMLIYQASGGAIKEPTPPNGELVGYNYVLDTNEDIVCVIPEITKVESNITLQNNSVSGSVTITATGGLLIDSEATIYLAPGEYTTIIPKVTYFDAIGTHSTPPI